MYRIAISCRRSDSLLMAGRIGDRLAVRYGKDSVFIDVNDLPLGIDFKEYIRKTWADIEVLIAVIGPHWLGAGIGGTARIFEDGDFIRLEVETALKRVVPIIPVLVQGATMPAADQLPDSLRPLADRNAAYLDGGRDFQVHMDQIIQAIDRILISRHMDISMQESPRAANSTVSGKDLRIEYFHPLPLIRDISITVLALLVGHYLIVSVLDLSTLYLRIDCFAVPFVSGLVCFRQPHRFKLGEATAIGLVIALLGVVGMSLSASFHSGQPVLPATLYEWQEVVEYFFIVLFAFLTASVVSRLDVRWH